MQHNYICCQYGPKQVPKQRSPIWALQRLHPAFAGCERVWGWGFCCHARAQTCMQTDWVFSSLVRIDCTLLCGCTGRSHVKVLQCKEPVPCASAEMKCIVVEATLSVRSSQPAAYRLQTPGTGHQRRRTAHMPEECTSAHAQVILNAYTRHRRTHLLHMSFQQGTATSSELCEQKQARPQSKHSRLN